MSSDKSMVVAVRIRPLSHKEIESGSKTCCELLPNNVIVIKKGGTGGYLKSEQPLINEYAFDSCFDEAATQSQVYESTAKCFIPKLLDGLNVTVFCYGATGILLNITTKLNSLVFLFAKGSGKTHTMLGSTRQDSATSQGEAGIIPNAVCDLFELIQEASSRSPYGEKWIVVLSYIEVYNEQVLTNIYSQPLNDSYFIITISGI